MLTLNDLNQRALLYTRDISFHELSPSSAKSLKMNLLEKTTDFKPDIYCQVAGVTFDNRQPKILAVKDVWEHQGYIEVSLIPEPNNKYDPNAVAVIAYLPDETHIGYLPKALCITCGKNIMGAQVGKGVCPSCGSKHIVDEFNKKVIDNLDKVSINWINKGPEKNSSFGVCLAIKLKGNKVIC